MSREPLLPEIHAFHIKSFEKEWAFLCGCASPESTRERIRKLLTEDLDWGLLFELAERHSAQGLLAMRLEEAEFANVPPQAREKLQARMRAQHVFTLSLTAELFRILQDFSRAHIDALLVKGPLLSLRAYGDPAVRNYVDLDLLVRHRDVPNATQHMTALGFTPKVPPAAIEAGKIPGEFVFQKLGTQRIVEIHTERTYRHYPKPMRLEDMFARKRTVMLDGREVPGLSLEDDLLLNCVHGSKDFWERLMWVSDVSALVTKHPDLDWKKARVAAADVGAERMLNVGVHLGALLFGIKLPAATEESIQKDPTSESLCRQILAWLPYAGDVPPSLPRRAVYRMEMAGGGISGAAYLLRLSLLPTESEWEEGKEEQRSWIWDAVRRPFRLLRKYGAAEREEKEK